MKLLIESAMIFFGTLMAAALVALGEPARADHAIGKDAAGGQAWAEEATPALARPLMGWHE